MRATLILYCLIFFSLFQSCSTKEPTKGEIAGVWKSKDGAIMNIKDDFSFNAINIPIAYYFRNSEKKYEVEVFSGEGKWNINDGQTHWEIDIMFTRSSIGESRFGNQLLLSGGGIFERSSPYKNIFIQVGDPDNNERYEFIKQ